MEEAALHGKQQVAMPGGPAAGGNGYPPMPSMPPAKGPPQQMPPLPFPPLPLQHKGPMPPLPVPPLPHSVKGAFPPALQGKGPPLPFPPFKGPPGVMPPLPIPPFPVPGAPFNQGALPPGPLPPFPPPVPPRLTEGAVYDAWTEYKDDQERPYYHNPIIDKTVWVKPDPPTDRDALYTEKDESSGAAEQAQADENKEDEEKGGDTAMKEDGEAEASKGKAKTASFQAVEGTPWRLIHTDDGREIWFNSKENRSEWTRPAETMGLPLGPLISAMKRERDEDGEGDAEKKAKEDAHDELTQEERVELFHSLLTDLKIDTHAKWAQVLQKIVFDDRYHALKTMPERRAAFEQYCKKKTATVTEQRKTSKKRVAVENFQELLKKTPADMSYYDFQKKNMTDPRYQAVPPKERRDLFNKHVEQIKQFKKQEEEEQKKSFIELISKRRYSESWTATREMLEDEGFHAKVDWGTYEKWFRDYQKNKEKYLEDDKDKSEAQKRKEREERALRLLRAEHEKQQRNLRKELDIVGDEKRRQRAQAIDVAKDEFTALLAQHIKDPEKSYRSSVRVLEKDVRYKELSEKLSSDDREQLFHRHRETLEKQRVNAFNSMLQERSTISFVSEWRDVVPMLEEDKRYHDVPRSLRERLFREHKEELRRKVSEDMRKCLRDMERQVPFINKDLAQMHELCRAQHAYTEIEQHDKKLLDDILKEFAGRAPPKQGQNAGRR